MCVTEIFGRRKLAPELAPDGKGRAGFSGDESPGKAQETLENRTQRAQEGRGREPLQRFRNPLDGGSNPSSATTKKPLFHRHFSRFPPSPDDRYHVAFVAKSSQTF